MDSMKTDIALIKQKSGFIDDKLANIITEIGLLKGTLGNTEILKKVDLIAHEKQDEKMFRIVLSLTGFGLTLLVFILGKLIHG